MIRQQARLNSNNKGAFRFTFAYLGLFAILCQIAVFAQPLLPKKFQIEPACVMVMNVAEHSHMQHLPVQDNSKQHTCLYCFVYGHLPIALGFAVQAVMDGIQIRILMLVNNVRRFFEIFWNGVFLLPQGRAPPVMLRTNSYRDF